MSPGEVIGWTVAIGFPVTFGLAVLGLIKKDFLAPVYVKGLFGAVILELITAGFWLFYQDFEVRFTPSIADQKVILFGSGGEPLPETKLRLGDEPKQTFNENTTEGFSVARDFELEGERLQIVTRDKGFSLGHISLRSLSDRLAHSLLSPDQHLDLGLYYAQRAGPSRERRDPSRAVRHLLTVLATKDHQTDYHSRAAQQLFQLKERLTRCEDFQSLADATRNHVPPPNRFKELGDIYLAMALYLSSLDGEHRQAVRHVALRNFVYYLNLPTAPEGSEPFLEARSVVEREVAEFPAGHPVRAALEEGSSQSVSRVLGELPETFGCPAAPPRIAESSRDRAMHGACASAGNGATLTRKRLAGV